MGGLVFLGLGALGVLGVLGALLFFINPMKGINSGPIVQILFIIGGIGTFAIFVAQPQIGGLAISIGIAWAVITGQFFKK